MQQQSPPELVVMGRIAAPYGIRGWVNVLPDTEYLDGLFDYPVWWINTRSGWREYTVEDAKVHGNHLTAKLQGLEDRDQALLLKGKQIAVPREQLPAAEDGEFYWSDLVGMSVKNLQQVDLGQVKEVFATGANDVLVVQQGEQERLIPFIAQVVLDVRLADKCITVDWGADF